MLGRRTLLQFLAGAFVVPARRFGLFGQAPSQLAASQVATLEALAEVVLPSRLDSGARAAVVRRFATWVRDYREGADRGHGYGSSTIRSATGPAPSADYPAQFAALDTAAMAAGGVSFAALDPARRLAVVRRTLEEPDRITRLPSSPSGESLVADFIGFYFNSPDAWDVAYDAAIGADRCRSLDGSDQPPSPLGGR